MFASATPALWIGFTLFVVALLALDLGVFHRRPHEVRFREALGWSVFWIALAGLFNGGVYWMFGAQKGLEFTTGYLIEKALSVDNIFVFLVIFSTFAVPKEYQHRVLFWGIFGALVMRAIFIFAGAALLAKFHWVIYIFGAILLLTGVKLLRRNDEAIDPRANPLFRLFARFVPTAPAYDGARFFTRHGGKLVATPLLAVLVALEATDLVFAVDSIPAIFAVTTDPFIVYTSNIFAILGLRALFFLLAGVMQKFHLLKYALAAILIFVGMKMLIVDLWKVPTLMSLLVIATLLAAAAAGSLLVKRPVAEPLEAPGAAQ